MSPGEPVDAEARPRDLAEARSDLDLIAAINHGDSAAFEELYFRYRDWVVALAFRFTGHSDTALDVLQDTFLYVLKKFPGFRLTASFKTFLYPAVRNLSITARQKTARYQTSASDAERLEQLPAPATEQNSGELEFMLGRLPEEQREVILLRFVDGLTLNEIAEAMSVPLGTVKSRLHNALESLRHDPRVKSYFEK